MTIMKVLARIMTILLALDVVLVISDLQSLGMLLIGFVIVV